MLVLGVSGSPAHSRRTRSLVALALEGASSVGPDVQTALVDLAETPADWADGRPRDQHSPSTRAILAQVEAAQAFIFGTPMYRAGMTGALKNLLDLIPSEFMVGKSAALLATGGSFHHYLGVELGLRASMAFFQVHTVPSIIYGVTFQVVEGRPDDVNLAAETLQLGRDVVDLARAVNDRSLGPALFYRQ